MSDQNQQIDPETQKILNTPLQDAAAVSAEDEKLLNLVVSLVNEGKINLYQPATLINSVVYEKLDSVNKGKIDFEAMNLLAAIREIKGLHDAGFAGTYQIANLVGRMRATKERLEVAGGDIFII